MSIATSPSIPLYAPFLTASGIDRFDACNGSALLARVRQESRAATAGTSRHDELLRPGALPAKALAWFGGRDPMYEAAFAVDAEGAASLFLGQYIARAYAVPGPAWIAGTADAVQVIGDVLSVGDLKTGWGQAHGSLPPPEDAGQLLGLAWMAWHVRAARALRDAAAAAAPAGLQSWIANRGDGEIRGWRPARIRLAWFVDHDGKSEVEDAEVHPDDLQRWGVDLARAVVVARNSVPSLARGPYCTHCDRFDACPAQGDAIRRLASIPRGDEPLSPEQLASAYRDLEDAERVCAEARAAFVARVDGADPIPIGQTHELTTIRAHVARIDAGQAARAGVLGARLQECLTVTLTQEGLKRGLGSPRAVEAAMAELDAAGAVNRVPSAPYLKVVRRRRRRGEA